MNLLLISHLFPHPADPLKGSFVLEKARALSVRMTVDVVAPVSWFPLVRSRSAIPEVEEAREVSPACSAMRSASRSIAGRGFSPQPFLIHHPGYLALPDFLFAQRWLPYARSLRAFFQRHPVKADLCQIEWVYPDAYAALDVLKNTGVKTIITIHGKRSLGLDFPHSRRPLVTRPLQQADRIVTVSQDLRRILNDQGDIAPEKIMVIPNGFDASLFRPMARDTARRQLGLPSDIPIAVTTARLSPEKALDSLIQAMTFSRTPNLRLYILGDGPLKPVLTRHIRSLRLSQAVFLMGGVSRPLVPVWLAAANLFCLPSLHEGFPVAVIEALACGIPVVATRVGGTPEIIDSDHCGLLVPPSDAQSLAAALDRALSTRWNPATLAARAASLTWEENARRHEELYRKLLE